MLLYFSVGGFCSFKETQDLFLTAYLDTRLKNTKYEKNLNYNSNTIKFEIGILDKKENIYDYSIEFNKENLIYEKLECNDKIIYEFKNNTLFSKKLPNIIKNILKRVAYGYKSFFHFRNRILIQGNILTVK